MIMDTFRAPPRGCPVFHEPSFLREAPARNGDKKMSLVVNLVRRI